jgi:hypothetical protein
MGKSDKFFCQCCVKHYHCGPPRAHRVLMLSLAGGCPVFWSMPVLTPTTGKGKGAGPGVDWAPAHDRAATTQAVTLHILHCQCPAAQRILSSTMSAGGG